jgi:hypothetical protein
MVTAILMHISFAVLITLDNATNSNTKGKLGKGYLLN